MNITRQDKITNKPTLTYGNLKLFDLFRFSGSTQESIGVRVGAGHIWLAGLHIDGAILNALPLEKVILIDHELIIKGEL